MDRSLGDGGMPLLGDLGLRFEHYGEGWVDAVWEPTPTACNPAGAVHGGVFAVIHDAAMNFAANSAMESGDRAVTLSVGYSVLRAAAAGDRLTVRGEAVRLTHRVGFVEVAITDAAGAAVSTASGTLALRRRDGGGGPPDRGPGRTTTAGDEG